MALPDPDDAVANAEFFELSLDHLCVAGFDGYWKRVNPSWTRSLGWTAEELMSKPLIEFVHPDDREATLSARTNLKAGEPLEQLENRYLCKDGSYRWFAWKSVAHADRQLVYAIARDVTAEREAKRAQELLQRQLVFADRMASVGTLAAGVAHEINNPLAYVMANLDALLEEIPPALPSLPAHAAEWVQLAGEAREGAERIRRIVRGMMTFSRAEEERRKVIDVRPVIELSINMTFNEIRHRARLVKDYGPIPSVEADDSRLGQVFINLLVNAAHAIAEGNADANEIRVVTSTDSRGWAVLEVRDTGRGISPDVLDRIFDPFFTTKPVGVGTGLGLSICHTIVTSMGGEIRASSGPSGGTVFRVTLPPAPAPMANDALPSQAPSAAGHRTKVLVVDDEPHIGTGLRRLLSRHEVTAVTSARGALEILRAQTDFDIILLDLMMPEMSGMELYDEIVKREPALAARVVFMTGGAFTPSARAFLERVPNTWLEKPFDPAKLRALVDDHVRGKPPPR